MATPNYDINYNDNRFKEVEADKKAALNEVDVTYGNMVSQSEKYYQEQIDASKNWADKQSQLQQEKTDFAIEQIERDKAQAKKDYTKEQSGAYVDWQKQSNEYGANAEQMAAQGLDKSGYSESSQVGMYNTYQNRVATARAAFDLAKQNYDNAITEARLQNSSVLAEIAFETLQKQMELSLQGFQYKNQLLTDMANKKAEIERDYHNRYQDILKQINAENALAEEVRQYNATLEEEKRQFDILHPVSGVGSDAGINKDPGGDSDGSNIFTDDSDDKSTGNNSLDESSNNAVTAETLASILALGLGPISASTLNTLVAQGKVQEYEEDGAIMFRNTPTTGNPFTNSIKPNKWW